MDTSKALRLFGIEGGHAYKEKSSIVCRLDGGLHISIRKTEAPERAILFWHAVKERLHERGFNTADRFLAAPGEPPYREGEDGLYVAAYCPAVSAGFKETDFGDGGQFLRVTAKCAEMHDILSGFADAPSVYDEAEYAKTAAELTSWKKTVNRAPSMSDFDVLFLKNYEHCLRGLQDWRDYSARASGFCASGGGVTVCHNALKEETVFCGRDGGVFVTYFNECAAGHYSADLAALIKRHVKCAKEPLSMDAILSEYAKFNPIDQAGLDLLSARLRYPDALIKLCRGYYAKKRTWIPGAFLAKMQNIDATREKFKKYIDGIG